MKHVKTVVWLVAVFIAGYVLARVIQERSVGAGPIETAAHPAGPTRQIAFAADAVAGTISMIDIEKREVIGSLDVIPDGARVGLFRNPGQALYAQKRLESRGGLNFAQDTDVSPDGRVLYVARAHLGDVAAFDLATGELLWRRSIGIGRADHMAIAPGGRMLFIADIRNARVKRLDARTGKIDGQFVSGIFPHGIEFSHDGKLVYNASLGDMTIPLKDRDRVQEPSSDHGFAYEITVVKPDTLEVVDRYRFPSGIRPFYPSHDNSHFYAQLSNAHVVVDYDARSRAIAQTLQLPIAEGIGPDDWGFEAPHHGLAMTSDGKLLCVAARASDYAGIISVEPLALVATVPVADAPSWAVIDARDELCLTANTRADEVSFVSLVERRELSRLRVGRGVKHITIAQIPDDIVAAIRSRGLVQN